MKKVSVRGLTAYYRDAGVDSLKVVFIHGALGSSLAWIFQLKIAEEEGFSAVAPNLIGHGGSSDVEDGVDISYLSHFVGEFMDALDIKKAVVVGHSMGGAIAMTLAVETPERVEGLVLANTGARLRVLPELFEGLKSNFKRTVEEIIAPMSFSSKTSKAIIDLSVKEMLNTPPHVAYRNFKACDSFNITDRLNEVKVPTLIIAGREDRLAPAKLAEDLHRRIASSKLVIVEESGHATMLERPEEFNEALTSFFSSIRV